MPNCAYCLEPVLENEPQQPINNGSAVVHQECMFRKIAGCAEHINGECSCDGGSKYQPDGISLREGARRALAAYQAQAYGALLHHMAGEILGDTRDEQSTIH